MILHDLLLCQTLQLCQIGNCHYIIAVLGIFRYTLPNDWQFNLAFQFKSIFKLEFQAEFGIKLGIPIQMGIDLGECIMLTAHLYDQVKCQNCYSDNLIVKFVLSVILSLGSTLTNSMSSHDYNRLHTREKIFLPVRPFISEAINRSQEGSYPTHFELYSVGSCSSTPVPPPKEKHMHLTKNFFQKYL